MKIKKYNLFTIGLLALSLSIFSCSGDDGDVGPNGFKGEQGIQGEVGPAGADGSIMYSGEGEPAADTGIKGDYYCDSATGMLYGPKKEPASWEDSDSFSLSGQDGTNGTNGSDGEDGTNGSKTLSGTVLPTNAIGNTGDYYLNKETYTLYGPKAKLAPIGQPLWGMGLMLKGADGNANVRTFKLTIGGSDWTEANNTPSTFTKTLKLSTSFSALNQDMYENGIVLVYYTETEVSQNLYDHVRSQLPKIETTPSKNLLNTYFTIHDWENPQDSNYGIRITKELSCITDSEVLTTTTDKYHIKLITGQTAVQLKANKDNQIEFNRLVGELAE
jgi:hypothetical protein